MRTQLLFDDVDASSIQTSSSVSMDKRTNWDLIVTTSGTNGAPRLILEVAYTGGKCLPLPTDWFAVENTKDCTFVFDIDTTPTIIKKKEQTANWLRVRLEPNGVTTGTLKAFLAIKDYP